MDKDISKEFALKLAIMVESTLINDQYYTLWCDEMIEKLENPPLWIIDLAITKNSHSALKIINEYAYSEPFPNFKSLNLNDFYIACLYVKYQQKQISWDVFLLYSGNYSDGNDCSIDCGDFYHLLNKFEDSEYSMHLEQ